MKQAVTDLYNLLSTNPLLLSDTGDNIKVNTFAQYANPLIDNFPAILLIRRSKAKQIKTIAS